MKTCKTVKITGSAMMALVLVLLLMVPVLAGESISPADYIGYLQDEAVLKMVCEGLEELTGLEVDSREDIPDALRALDTHELSLVLRSMLDETENMEDEDLSGTICAEARSNGCELSEKECSEAVRVIRILETKNAEELEDMMKLGVNTVCAVLEAQGPVEGFLETFRSLADRVTDWFQGLIG